HGVNQRRLRISVHRLGAAAQAGAIAGLFGFEGVIEEAHVLAARAFSGTRWTAEDSGARDAKNERAVERAVAIGDRLPAAGAYLRCRLNCHLLFFFVVVRFWSSLHRCFFCEYRICGHGGNIGQSQRADYPNVAVKLILLHTACVWVCLRSTNLNHWG